MHKLLGLIVDTVVYIKHLFFICNSNTRDWFHEDMRFRNDLFGAFRAVALSHWSTSISFVKSKSHENAACGHFLLHVHLELLSTCAPCGYDTNSASVWLYACTTCHYYYVLSLPLLRVCSIRLVLPHQVK